MNYRKRKQQENLKKPKKEKNTSYENDPIDSKCPYCGKSKRGCSYVNSLSRAWMRDVCKKKLGEK
jgi:hypothetical protein